MGTIKEILLPDIGDFKNVDVIEVLVSPGDSVQAEDSLVTLESDKATIEVPSPDAGVVREVKVKVGDKVSHGTPLLVMELAAGATPEPREPATQPAAGAQETAAAPAAQPPAPQSAAPLEERAAPSEAPTGTPSESFSEIGRPHPARALSLVDEREFATAHASPSVRRFARELGVDLGKVDGTGPKGRALREDVQAYVKAQLTRPEPAAAPSMALPEMPHIDFAAFGPIETQPLSKIKRVGGANLHRNWLHIPHVTQFDEADITDLEAFRKAQSEEAEKRAVKLTLLTFLMKASVAALRAFPEFNASLDGSGEQLILKKYFHVGVAVDTPQGLVVPVIRDVDRKGLFDLAQELRELSAKARERKLTPGDMQGGCFTISSLGGLGGTAFTPIVNAPEVAILGVSRAATKPVYRDAELVPRLILPLALSYDHRVIDGATAVRFTTYLSTMLSDTRRLLL